MPPQAESRAENRTLHVPYPQFCINHTWLELCGNENMRLLASVLLLVMLPSALSAGPSQQPNAQVSDLKTLSLEELIQIDVMTVSRAGERRIDAPAAVTVITSEDIRRYGVDTLA